MDRATLAYAIPTALFCFAMGAGGLADLAGPEDMVKSFEHMGYPLYVMTLLGVWKVLGVVAIAAPGFPRLKEWAYAGFTFNLTGAAFSHLMSGDGVGGAAPAIVLLGLGLASWWLRPASRKLADA